jgi:hypothetical protein
MSTLQAERGPHHQTERPWQVATIERVGARFAQHNKTMSTLVLALFMAHGLGVVCLGTRMVVPSTLVFMVPPLLVVTATHDPLSLACLVAYVAWIGSMISRPERESFGAITTFVAALFVDAAAFAAWGHYTAAVEIAAFAPLARRLLLANQPYPA